MPLGAVTTSTWVATFSACQSSICALLAMKLYSRRGGPGDEDLSAEPDHKEAADGAFRTYRTAGRENFWFPAARIRAAIQPAAVVCCGLFYVLCRDVRCHFFAAGVERGRTPRG